MQVGIKAREVELEQDQDASETNQYGEQHLHAPQFLGPTLHFTFI